MLALFMAAWMSPVGRQVMIVVAITLVLLGAWYGFARHYISIGTAKGDVKATERSEVAVNGMREADRTQTGGQITAADVKAAAADAKATAAQQRADHLEREVDELRRQGLADRANVARIPAAGLHAYNVEHLAVRPAGDATSGYTEPEERRIAELVTVTPNLEGQLDKLSKRVDELAARGDALQDKVSARDEKYAALAGYTNRLEGYFVTVYNATPKKRRAWKCLQVWRCGESKLAAPDPGAFLPTRPK